MAVKMPNLPSRPTSTMVALAVMPILRDPAVRSGRVESTVNRINLEACLGHFVGQVNISGCTHCTTGSGVWTLCVSVAGKFGGSCTNCHYNRNGARCSLRKHSRGLTDNLQTETNINAL